MNFNLQIKEDAALNYAKLSYESGNPYKDAADVLQDYLKNYPKIIMLERLFPKCLAKSLQHLKNLVCKTRPPFWRPPL